jgi:hypothetical protein
MTNRIPRLRRAHPEPTLCQGNCGRLLTSGFWCTACRLRKCRGSIVTGEACAVHGCGVDSPRVLRWHRFTDDTRALCANHDALAGRRALTWAVFEAEAIEHALTGWAQTA